MPFRVAAMGVVVAVYATRAQPGNRVTKPIGRGRRSGLATGVDGDARRESFGEECLSVANGVVPAAQCEVHLHHPYEFHPQPTSSRELLLRQFQREWQCV